METIQGDIKTRCQGCRTAILWSRDEIKKIFKDGVERKTENKGAG